MTDQTIAAVYDTAAHADAAVRDLKAAGVPDDAVSSHAKGSTSGTTAGEVPAHQPGFWASLFGGESADTTTYAHSIESGSTVVTVRVPEQYITRVNEILETHNPIDFDERAASYGTAQATSTRATDAPAMPAARQTDNGTIKLAAESLTVGKRAVNRGTTRVRRYVVETPVEEQVSLHSERVTVDRHGVADGRPATAADFGDRVIEMTETSEEAVVGKTVRVVEEITLRKEGVDRTETVRDTVRREEAEVEEVPATETTTSRTATDKGSATPPARATKI